MKYAKPAAGTEARNKWSCARPDRMAIGLTLNEGSGSSLTNIGTRTSSPWNAPATANSPTWTTDSLYGAILDFGGNTQHVTLATVSGDTNYKRGSIAILFKYDATSSRTIFGSGSSSGTGGQFQVVLSGTTTTRVRHFAAAASHTWDFTTAPSTWYLLLWTWGEKSFTARLFSATQEIAGSASVGTPTTDTSAYVITSGQTVRLASNSGSTGLDGQIAGFWWWDWQLTDDFIVHSLVNDAFINCRTIPSTVLNHAVTPYPFGTTATTTSYRAVAKTGGSDPVSLKVEAASDALFQNIVATATTAYTSAGSNLTATLTGLSASTNYWVRHSYALQSVGTYVPMAGGVSRLRTTRPAGSSFTWATYGDSHITSGSDVGSAILNGYFQDNLNNGECYVMSHAMRDMQRRGDLDFIIAGGDELMQNQAGAYTPEEIVEHYVNFTAPVSRVGTRYFAIGNWENETGTDAGIATTAALRQSHLPCPTDGDSSGRHYGFEHGEAAILVLECESAVTESSNLKPVWRINDTQKAYAETFLSQTTRPWKFIVIHKWPGGVKSGQTSAYWYGRGSGAHLFEDRTESATSTTWEAAQTDSGSALYDATGEFFESQGVVDEQWLMELAEEHRAVMLMGHDHSFCWCTPVLYPHVHIFHWPTLCSSYNFGAITHLTVSGVAGDTSSNKNEYYGDFRQLGADLAHRGIHRTENSYGYLVINVTTDTVTVTNRVIFPAQPAGGLVTKQLNDECGFWGATYPLSGSTVTVSETPEVVHWIGQQLDSNANNDEASYTAQRYVMTTDFSDLNQSTDYETPYASAVVSFNSSGATDSDLTVSHSPRDSFSVTLRRDHDTGDSIIAAEPVLKSVTPLDYLADRDIIVYQQAELPTIAWFCVDNNNAAIDLSGATLSFKVYDRFGTTIFSATTADDLEVGGELNNRVTLTVSAADTATAGGFRYDLWRTSGSDLLLARGAFEIRKAVK